MNFRSNLYFYLYGEREGERAPEIELGEAEGKKERAPARFGISRSAASPGPEAARASSRASTGVRRGRPPPAGLAVSVRSVGAVFRGAPAAAE